MTTQNRRAVRGIACKPCVFCGRTRTDADGREMNYQYLDETTNQWDSRVYCSKVCRSAYRAVNAVTTR